jgi:hypothetical protein
MFNAGVHNIFKAQVPFKFFLTHCTYISTGTTINVVIFDHSVACRLVYKIGSFQYLLLFILVFTDCILFKIN